MNPAVAILRFLIRVYQYAISPVLGPSCRYQPTCSEYAAEALATHGAAVGSWLALKRFGRCHPLGGHGYDPVPQAGARCHPMHEDCADG